MLIKCLKEIALNILAITLMIDFTPLNTLAPEITFQSVI